MCYKNVFTSIAIIVFWIILKYIFIINFFDNKQSLKLNKFLLIKIYMCVCDNQKLI